MTRDSLRFLYRLIVYLHPASFQYRFGDEMLWIFDEELKRDNVARLFFDGILSLTRQRCTVKRTSPQAYIGFGALIVESGPGPARIVQAALMAAVFCAGFVLFVGFGSRLTASIQRPQSVLRCIFTLQASPPVETFSVPLKVLR